MHWPWETRSVKILNCKIQFFTKNTLIKIRNEKTHLSSKLNLLTLHMSQVRRLALINKIIGP